MLFISTTATIKGFVICHYKISYSEGSLLEKKKKFEKTEDFNLLQMVDAVVGLIVQKLHDVLIKEAEFLSGVRGQVERLHNELRWMQSFLKDADAKRLKDEGVRLWVAEIRDTSYDAEDFIDTFILKATSSTTTRRRDRFNKFFKHPIGIFKEWRHLHHFGKEIEVILTKVESISNSRERYGITVNGEDASSSSTTNDDKELRKMRRVYPHVEDEDIIGLDEHTETLVSELIKEEGKRRVVSIFGVGGLGKTTLAKKVYNHDVIKSHFDCHAWAFISEQCSRKDVFLEILKKVSSPSDNELKMIRQMDEEELVERLYKFLQGKRYLVVLDDIWRPKQWNILNPALPNGKMGSKVLLTTRNKRVSLHADRWSLHLEPRCLTDKESWQLFCKKAFPKDMTGTSFSLPAGLEKLGKEMSSKCGGLPLGVSVLGGLMATKRAEIDEWVIVRNSMSSHLNNGECNVLEILALSYNCLPYHLKPCFLYCGLFPEDFEIPTKKLIQLWSAEGFLRQEGEETMEEVGERQLDELIQRCMIQIGKRGVTGRVKTCRVHDLMRDLCLLKAREINFLGTYHPQLQEESVGKSSSTTGSSTSYKLRRYSIHSGQERYATFEHSAPHLRTLLLVHPHSKEHLYSSFSMRICYTNFRLIRVLDLWGMDIIERCKFAEIASLINLRYFGVMCNSIEEPPPSIGNLQSLETLNLRCHSNLWALPNTIWKMEQLRHLYLSHICSSGHLRLNTLRNLQILYIICAGKWIEEGSLENMSNLRKLGIRSLSRSQVKKVLDAIAVKSLNHPIRSLFLDLHPGEEFPSLESLTYCGHLLKLHLCGHMSNLLNWFPTNLTKLTLANSELRQDPMLILEKLSNLKILDLRRSAYLGKKMVCSERGFPQLQHLQFDYLSELEDWRIREGAMPCLKSLRIQVCNKLRNVPKGLKFLKTLQKLEIYSMPRNFSDRIVRGGDDWDIVKHISSITIRDWS